MSLKKCKECKYWNDFLGCIIFWQLKMIHIGRERFDYLESFPNVSMSKGVCAAVSKAWTLEKRR